jgi:hypothetical protein
MVTVRTPSLMIRDIEWGKRCLNAVIVRVVLLRVSGAV